MLADRTMRPNKTETAVNGCLKLPGNMVVRMRTHSHTTGLV